MKCSQHHSETQWEFHSENRQTNDGIIIIIFFVDNFRQCNSCWSNNRSTLNIFVYISHYNIMQKLCIEYHVVSVNSWVSVEIRFRQYFTDSWKYLQNMMCGHYENMFSKTVHSKFVYILIIALIHVLMLTLMHTLNEINELNSNEMLYSFISNVIVV